MTRNKDIGGGYILSKVKKPTLTEWLERKSKNESYVFINQVLKKIKAGEFSGL